MYIKSHICRQGTHNPSMLQIETDFFVRYIGWQLLNFTYWWFPLLAITRLSNLVYWRIFMYIRAEYCSLV